MSKVTLAMPIYNVEKYIERALLSALNQTYQNIEYILIDDKGIDNSMKIINRILKNHPRGTSVRIIEHVVNSGLGATRNTAINEATGEYLFFMDSDDEIMPECIEILYKSIQTSDVNYVAGSFALVYPDRVVNSAYVDSTPSRVELVSTKYYSKNSIKYPLWNKLFKLDFIKDNKIYCIPEHLNEDVWFTFQAKICTNKCRLLSNITYKYYINQASITDFSSFDDQKRSRIINQYCEIDRLCKDYLMQKSFEDVRCVALPPLMFESLRFANLALIIDSGPVQCDSFLRRNFRRFRSATASTSVRDCFSKLFFYPLTITETFKLKEQRRVNFCFCIVSHLPFYMQLLLVGSYGLFHRLKK